MSVVAVRISMDKIEIASDSITVRGWTQDKGHNHGFAKLSKVQDMYIGFTGFAEEGCLFQVFCETHKPDQSLSENAIINFMSEFANWKNGKTGKFSIENDYIMVVNNRVFVIEGFLVREVATYEAIGAGRDYALAVLHLDHSAEKAVTVASELSVYCEKPVRVFVVEK